MKTDKNITGWQTQIAPLQARWQALGERERGALLLAAWALGLLLVWLIAVQPALRTLKASPAKLDAVEQQLQAMQALALESQQLRAATAVPPAQALQALQSASERLGAGAKLTLSGERATLQLNGISSEALQAWLGEVRSAARARPQEAQLQRGPKGFSGSIVLALPGQAP